VGGQPVRVLFLRNTDERMIVLGVRRPAHKLTGGIPDAPQTPAPGSTASVGPVSHVKPLMVRFELSK
jgi:hypothetical protein